MKIVVKKTTFDNDLIEKEACFLSLTPHEKAKNKGRSENKDVLG